MAKVEVEVSLKDTWYEAKREEKEDFANELLYDVFYWADADVQEKVIKGSLDNIDNGVLEEYLTEQGYSVRKPFYP